MATRKVKQTDPKKTSPAGPYKTGMKTDRSTGVRQMTAEQKRAAAKKPKDGSQFLPKDIPAGSKANTPKSKTKPRSVASGPNWFERNMIPRDKNGKIPTGILDNMSIEDLRREQRLRNQ
jgi:hypothetical protein